MRAFAMVLLAAGTLSAQEGPRPRLRAGQDTNSAAAYYGLGMAKIAQDPVQAARGFYWATRLDPNFAEAWYGLWAASVLSFPDLKFSDYETGARTEAQDSVLHLVDSLRDRADYLNPLVHHGLDELILKRLAGDENLDQFIFGDPVFGGWLAYARGDFATSVDRYARAIKQYPKAPSLHWIRAKAFLMQLAYDSALAEMHLYRDAVKKREETKTWHFLATHEISDYTIGRIEELRGNLDGAREEYQAALMENLSYIPGHVALARLAVARHDTADALREMEQATETPEADRCYTYAVLLWASRRVAEAARHFAQAIAADSDYAPPYLSLAYIEEGSGEDSLAIIHYRRFLAIAPSTLTPQLATARQRLDGLLATQGVRR